MRNRLVIAAVCILGLPLLLSPSQKLTNPSPYATVALAGHNTIGGWCECGTPGCLCDPGEEPIGNRMSAPSTAPSKDRGVNHGSAPDADLASGLLTLALAFFFWLRLR